jgi:hypothetical protein
VFQAKNNARKLTLRKQLSALKKDAGEPVTKYVSWARELWADLANVGHKMEETEFVLAILAGLPGDFEIVTTLLETSSAELSLDDVLSKLLIVEQRVVKKDKQGESVAFYNKSRKPGGYKGKHKKDGDNDNKTGEGG